MNALALVSLVVALGTLTMSSRQVAKRLDGMLGLPWLGVPAVCAGLSLGMFMTVTSIVGRLFRSFDAGLAGAAMVGIALCFAAARSGPGLRGERLVTSRPPRRVRIGFFLSLVSMTALYSYLSWRYQMHDEHPIFGHKAMIEQLRFGEFPVYLPPLPGHDARYHYGFDILAGALARSFGWSADLSIDLVCVSMAAWMSLAAAALAIDEGADRSAPFAAIAIHLGAGLAFVLLAGVEGRHPRCLAQYHHPTCGVELFPTQLLNVFQHPVSVGVPLVLVLALLVPRAIEAATRGGGWRPMALTLASVSILLSGLSLGQFVYFALGALSILAALPFLLFGKGSRRAAIASLLGALSLGLLLSFASGGMLTPGDVYDANIIVFRRVPGFPPNVSLLDILRHHAINLGLGFVLLPLVAISVFRGKGRASVMLLAFALGGIAAAHLFDYTRSWDIVKFPSAASFALSLLYAIHVDAWLGERALPWRWIRQGGRIALIGTGLTAAFMIVFPLQGEQRLYSTDRVEVDTLVKRTIDWWRARGYRREELIVAQSNVSAELSVFGGLSVAAWDYDLNTVGVRREITRSQEELVLKIKATMDPDALRKLGARWVMFSDEEMQNLGIDAQRILERDAVLREGEGAGEREGGWVSLAATFDDPRPGKRRRIWSVRSP